jgi:hypothetical protein
LQGNGKLGIFTTGLGVLLKSALTMIVAVPPLNTDSNEHNEFVISLVGK